MNRKRSCPGVQNKESHNEPGSAMRPKSMATVVVVLRSVTPPASSTPIDFSVIAASVLSGSMSEIEPMKVVLPTAKPPSITILTTVGACAASLDATAALEGCDAIKDTLQKTQGQSAIGVVRCRIFGCPSGVNSQVFFFSKIRDQHPDHTQRKSGMSRELSNGLVLARSELQDLLLFRGETPKILYVGGRFNQRFHWQVRVGSTDAPPGHGIRPDRVGLVFRPLGGLNGFRHVLSLAGRPVGGQILTHLRAELRRQGVLGT